jgi:hypothetical protein
MRALLDADPTALSTLPGPPSTKHVTAAQINAVLSHYDHFLSFAVVRNPFDRFCSLYRYLARTQPAKLGGATFSDFEQLFIEGGLWIEQLHSIKPQVDFVFSADGTRLVERLIRFESLETGFRALSHDLGIDAPLGRHNVSGEDRGSYRDMFSLEGRKLISSRYRVDLETFGYSY